jgi:uncharacterized oligopeptide transporter (OPT) family protein
MKLSNLQIFRRIVIDFGTTLTLVVAAIAVFWACSFDGPLEMLSRYEHIIWAFAATAIATCRAYLEYLWRISLGIWSRIILWILIVITAYLAMCWIDTRVNRYDTFVNVFAFGLLIFLAPSLVISTAVYAVVSGSIGRSHGNS